MKSTASHSLALVSGAVLATYLVSRKYSKEETFEPIIASELPSDPYELLQEWITKTEKKLGFLASHTMVVATCGENQEEGATARTVVLQAASNELGGLLFGSSRNSLKGRQIQQNPNGEAVIRLGLHHQVRIRGKIRMEESKTTESFLLVAPMARKGLHALKQGKTISEEEHEKLVRQVFEADEAMLGGESKFQKLTKSVFGKKEEEETTPPTEEEEKIKPLTPLVLKKAKQFFAKKADAEEVVIPKEEELTTPPPSYVAFMISPTSFEFYSGGHPAYMNDRFLYVKDPKRRKFLAPQRLQS